MVVLGTRCLRWEGGVGEPLGVSVVLSGSQGCQGGDSPDRGRYRGEVLEYRPPDTGSCDGDGSEDVGSDRSGSYGVPAGPIVPTSLLFV